jgi:hypothetical protein
MMSLLVGLLVIEGVQYNLHQLTLSSNQLLEDDRLLELLLLPSWPLHWLFCVFTI